MMISPDGASPVISRTAPRVVRLSLCLLLASIVMVLLSSLAIAQDDEAPRVVAPEDIPGADVILLEGQSYLLDATGSTDNVGIVQ